VVSTIQPAGSLEPQLGSDDLSAIRDCGRTNGQPTVNDLARAVGDLQLIVLRLERLLEA